MSSRTSVNFNLGCLFDSGFVFGAGWVSALRTHQESVFVSHRDRASAEDQLTGQQDALPVELFDCPHDLHRQAGVQGFLRVFG
jgi:hypothetical protein